MPDHLRDRVEVDERVWPENYGMRSSQSSDARGEWPGLRAMGRTAEAGRDRTSQMPRYCMQCSGMATAPEERFSRPAPCLF